jgi:hypothetical protein
VIDLYHRVPCPCVYERRRDGYCRIRAWDGERERYVYEHQLVEIANGADPREVFSGGRHGVHHINGRKFDNRPGNLETLDRGEHGRLTMGHRPPGELAPDGGRA